MLQQDVSPFGLSVEASGATGRPVQGLRMQHRALVIMALPGYLQSTSVLSWRLL